MDFCDLRYNIDVVQTSFELLIYATASGKEPFNDWLDSLDRSLRVRVESRINRLMVMGHAGNAKALKDGLFELKWKNPPFRVYYSLVGKQIILLISAGDKSKQTDDIKKAKEYLADYRSRYGIKKTDT